MGKILTEEFNFVRIECEKENYKLKRVTASTNITMGYNKRLEAGQFQWPRTESEVRSITEQQFRWLMEGLTTHPQKQVKRLKKAPDYTL